MHGIQRRGLGPHYEQLDNLRCEGVAAATKTCRKICAGGIEWAVVLQIARDTIAFWRLCKRKSLLRHSGKRINTRTLLRFKKNDQITESTHLLGIKQIETKLAGAYGPYRQKKKEKDSSANRDKWVESLASAQAAMGNSTIEKKLRSLLLQEHQWKMGQRVRYA